MCSDIGMCGKSTEPSGSSGTSTAIRRAPIHAALGGFAVLGVLDDALAAGLARAAAVPEGDLDADLVLTHQVVADRAADVREDVALGRDALGFLDRVCHGGWGSLELSLDRLYAASGYDSAPMARPLGSLHPRIAALVAGTLGVRALAGCGSLVTVSSEITPPPPVCATPRP